MSDLWDSLRYSGGAYTPGSDYTEEVPRYGAWANGTYTGDFAGLVGQSWGGDGVTGQWVGSDLILSRQRLGAGARDFEMARYRPVGGALAPGVELTRVSDWSAYSRSSTAGFLAPAVAAFAAIVGGAMLAGVGSAAGGAAGASGSGVITGGSGLSAGATASGSGLGASIGSGLTLAAPTGTGAGLAVGAGSNIIGAGLGASLGAGSAIGAASIFSDGAIGAASIAPAVAPAGGGSILSSLGGGAGSSGLLGQLAPVAAQVLAPSIAQGVNQALAPKPQPLSLAGYSSGSVVPLLFAAVAVAAAVYIIRK